MLTAKVRQLFYRTSSNVPNVVGLFKLGQVDVSRPKLVLWEALVSLLMALEEGIVSDSGSYTALVRGL